MISSTKKDPQKGIKFEISSPFSNYIAIRYKKNEKKRQTLIGVSSGCRSSVSRFTVFRQFSSTWIDDTHSSHLMLAQLTVHYATEWRTTSARRKRSFCPIKEVKKGDSWKLSMSCRGHHHHHHGHIRWRRINRKHVCLTLCCTWRHSSTNTSVVICAFAFFKALRGAFNLLLLPFLLLHGCDKDAFIFETTKFAFFVTSSSSSLYCNDYNVQR